MANSAARDETGVLLLAEGLYKLRSACAFALVQGGNRETVELATEGIQRFESNAVFCLAPGCLYNMDPLLMPIGPYHTLTNVTDYLSYSCLKMI